MTERLDFFAPCPRGTEGLLADELRSLGCRSVRPLRSGVSFSGRLDSGYRALLWSRIASRVLLTLGRVPAASADALYSAVKGMPWEDHVRSDGTIAVDATGVNDELRNTQFTAVRVKDAIADRFVELRGQRPSVDTSAPDLLVNVVVRTEKAVISIDLSGPPLHQRGYREPGVQVEAPIKENLAAAVLAVAGWPEIATNGGSFVDPLCGSGTLAIEAALMAGDVAPGLTRRRWGFTNWLGHDAESWADLVEAAGDRREAGLAALPPIAASDNDERAITIARAAIRRAGVEGRIDLRQRELAGLVPPSAASEAVGLVATNPPYGERIDAVGGLASLYAELSERLRAGFPGWELAVITPDDAIGRGLGMQPERSAELYNGRILSPVRVFRVPGGPAEPLVLDEAATAFENRLRKMSRHIEKWARKAGVTCYRVYDADLPDYAVAVDVYNGAGDSAGKRWVHVAEYAPPPGIDPEKATARLEDVLAIVPGVLGVDADDVFLKVRERQRGSAQYARVSRAGVVETVEEAGLLFEVNLSDYLDTGLFLDHRDTRAWLRDHASGARFLNLFAYTGTATVCAAAGGASSTMTVDLSATYVEWAARNLARNGFTGPAHERTQTDVLQWLELARARGERYDLVFCDPPTFSNSKRMRDTWDVQRDHASLIAGLGELLSEDGTLVFSCNRRKFALDAEALTTAGLACKDVTARTIPRDFERRPQVHSCWLITHAARA